MDYKLEQFKKRKNAKKMKETKKQQQVLPYTILCTVLCCTIYAEHNCCVASEAVLCSTTLGHLRFALYLLMFNSVHICMY
jgi:hypothetical protein